MIRRLYNVVVDITVNYTGEPPCTYDEEVEIKILCESVERAIAIARQNHPLFIAPLNRKMELCQEEYEIEFIADVESIEPEISKVLFEKVKVDYVS